MKNYKQVKPNSYAWLKGLYVIWILLIAVFVLCFLLERKAIALTGISVMILIGVMFIVFARPKISKARKFSCLIHQHIVENSLCQIEIIHNREKYTFYPETYWKVDESRNTLFLCFRLTGNKINLRGLEQGLADRLKMICLNVYERRGYIEYLFQLKEEKQLVFSSVKEIPGKYGATEIALSDSLVWNFRQMPHFLISGATGSGKSTFCRFLISSLINCGVRVVYVDIKKDDEMEQFCRGNTMITYACEIDTIANAIKDVTDEFQSRAKDIDEIGVGDDFDYGFNPIVLVCDEIILLKLILPKKLYDETIARINQIIVGGRQKKVFCGMVTQSALAEYFGNSGIRGNIGLKVALGQMTSTELGMIFGNEFSDIKNLRYGEMGAGLIMRNGLDSRPREYVAPYIKV